jgi:hypothetical protein
VHHGRDPANKERIIRQTAPHNGKQAKLTTKTKILFNIAHTRTNTPAPSMKVDAIFFTVPRREPHSIGRGIDIRYISVEIFAANDTQITGFETAA